VYCGEKYSVWRGQVCVPQLRAPANASVVPMVLLYKNRAVEVAAIPFAEDNRL